MAILTGLPPVFSSGAPLLAAKLMNSIRLLKSMNDKVYCVTNHDHARRAQWFSKKVCKFNLKIAVFNVPNISYKALHRIVINPKSPRIFLSFAACTLKNILTRATIMSKMFSQLSDWC